MILLSFSCLYLLFFLQFHGLGEMGPVDSGRFHQLFHLLSKNKSKLLKATPSRLMIYFQIHITLARETIPIFLRNHDRLRLRPKLHQYKIIRIDLNTRTMLIIEVNLVSLFSDHIIISSHTHLLNRPI